MLCFENDIVKRVLSDDYSFKFNKKTGLFVRWGKTLDDDPSYSPFGPEILDIAVSDVCHKQCSWCYRSLTLKGNNMSYETFKKVFAKLPKTICQIAFSIGDIDGNPELFNIMEYCRNNNVVPNITINGERMTPRYYDLLSFLCGAAALSNYDKDTCYNAVYELIKRGMKQVNIHQLACLEKYQDCIDVMIDVKRDERLKDMNAVVFLALKKRGRGTTYNPLTKQQFTNIVDYAISSNISFGFDSCSSHNFLEAAKDKDNIEQLKMLVEPCEGTCFSYYVSVEGIGYPCSFCEGRPNYKGIDILNCNDFINDVWLHPETIAFRNRNIKSTGHCVAYDLKLT